MKGFSIKTENTKVSPVELWSAAQRETAKLVQANLQKANHCFRHFCDPFAIKHDLVLNNIYIIWATTV